MTQPPPPQGPPGPPVWQPQPGWPAPNPQLGFPPPPRRSGLKPWMWIGGAAVVVLILVAFVVNVARKGQHDTAAGDTHLKAGQCVATADFEKFHFTSTSCASADAVYELAGETSKGLCPDGKSPQDGPYFYATRNKDDPKAETLCFALNMYQGNCYALDLTAKTVTNIVCSRAPVIANSHTGVFRVAQRVDDSIDEAPCATAAKAMVFTVPQRVYCLTKLVD